jgi:hypothetical protein
LAEKQRKPPGPDSAVVVSTGAEPTAWVAVCAKLQGTICRSRVVPKTMGSWMSVRGVATSVSARTRTG